MTLSILLLRIIEAVREMCLHAVCAKQQSAKTLQSTWDCDSSPLGANEEILGCNKAKKIAEGVGHVEWIGN